MRKILTFAVLGALLVLSAPAQADTFVWKDPKGDFTMSFPDSWRLQTEDTPTTLLRIAGPLGEDRATCRMQVQDDGRVHIYPRRLSATAVAEKLDQNFWEGHIAQYQDAQLAELYIPASLGGQGDATAIKFGFVEDGSPMYGVMIGSIYGGKRYVASCSSKAEVYPRWSDIFASILDSIELETKYHPFAHGYYRDFLADPKLVLPRVKPGTMHKNSYSFRGNKYNYDAFAYNQ